jgi:hypothetical protein
LHYLSYVIDELGLKERATKNCFLIKLHMYMGRCVPCRTKNGAKFESPFLIKILSIFAGNCR